MLTKVISERFSKHHSHLLAYMAALEDAARSIESSGEPVQAFQEDEPVFLEFLDFMGTSHQQHEKEEERVLHPVLEGCLEKDEAQVSDVPLGMVRTEHSLGMDLVDEMRLIVSSLRSEKTSASSDYYDLSRKIREVVVHFRNHVKTEDSLIMPATERLIPDDSDQLWASCQGLSGKGA